MNYKPNSTLGTLSNFSARISHNPFYFSLLFYSRHAVSIILNCLLSLFIVFYFLRSEYSIYYSPFLSEEPKLFHNFFHLFLMPQIPLFLMFSGVKNTLIVSALTNKSQRENFFLWDHLFRINFLCKFRAFNLKMKYLPSDYFICN